MSTTETFSRPSRTSDFGEIRVGDCRDQLKQLDSESIRLSVFSPPYNIGKEYDEYDDRISQYDWKQMMKQVFSSLY